MKRKLHAVTIQPFANHQQFLQMHFVLLDHVMPALSPNAWKTLCYIMRKTKGYQQEADAIPFSQISEGTGIKHNSTIHKALMELQGYKWNQEYEEFIHDARLWPLVEVVGQEQIYEGGNPTNVYRLNVEIRITIDN